MEKIWEYLESKGCKFHFAHPFLDGAEERKGQLAQRRRGAKAKPPAQPAGGSVPRESKQPPAL
eukprot:6312862-Pyramimonas_sp.AAC.1